MRAEVVEDYLFPNNYVTVTPDNTLENYPNSFFSIYTYNDEPYVKVGDQAILDEITLTPENNGVTTPKLLGFSQQKLRDIINHDESVSLIFFFSQDGAVLESGYATIDEVQPNEIVFFLEQDSLLNMMSVARVKSGINIQPSTTIPAESIACLAEFFNVPIDSEKVNNVFTNHFKDKKPEENDGILTYLFNIDDYILELAGDGLKLLIGKPLIFIGEKNFEKSIFRTQTF